MEPMLKVMLYLLLKINQNLIRIKNHYGGGNRSSYQRLLERKKHTQYFKRPYKENYRVLLTWSWKLQATLTVVLQRFVKNHHILKSSLDWTYYDLPLSVHWCSLIYKIVDFQQIFKLNWNCIGGVMVSALVSSAVYCGFEP